MNVVSLPVVWPLVAAGLLIGVPGVGVRRWLHVGAGLGQFVVGLWLMKEVWAKGILVVHFGDWPAPFGISFVADALSALLVMVAGFVSWLVAVFSLADVRAEDEKRGFFAMYHLLVMAVCGAFLTGDFFNLFVWFEVMLMASFVLLALGSERAQLVGGLKYLVLNLLSSALLLTAVALLYAETGTLSMARMAQVIGEQGVSFTALAGGMLLFVAFCVKAAVFPVFGWLPDSYHTPRLSVTALFGGLLTKVGVYALMRVFTLIFPVAEGPGQGFVVGLSIVTMVTGVLGAAAQFEMKRLLAFHIVSQIGYMTLGLGLFSAGALAAALYYVVHNILAKTNLFLVAGAVERRTGSTQLKRIGGLYGNTPWLAVVFLVSAMALAGMPPLSGFLGKYYLVKEAVPGGHWWAIAAALGVGMLTLYSMVKIWAEAFWKASPESDLGLGQVSGEGLGKIPWPMWFAMVVMALGTVAISATPEWIFQIVQRAGEELMEPDRYIEAVLGNGGGAVL